MKKTIVYLSLLLLACSSLLISLKAYSQNPVISQFTGVRTSPTSDICKLTLTAFAPYSAGWYSFDVEKSSSSTGPFSAIGSEPITTNTNTTYNYYDNNFISYSYYRIKFLNELEDMFIPQSLV